MQNTTIQQRATGEPQMRWVDDIRKIGKIYWKQNPQDWTKLEEDNVLS